MYDGVSSPVTQTFGLGLFEQLTNNELTAIERFFQDRKAPVCHEVCPLADISVTALLSERGYTPVEFTSVTYRRIQKRINLHCSLNKDIEVRPICAGEENLWAEVAAKGWGHVPELTDFLRELAPVSTCREDAISFIAELSHQPIAVGVLCLNGGVGLLAGACTIPEARKQGAQLAMLDARLRYAAAHGCDLAMMCAAPGSASQRNAERHGFRIAYTRVKWQLRP